MISTFRFVRSRASLMGPSLGACILLGLLAACGSDGDTAGAGDNEIAAFPTQDGGASVDTGANGDAAGPSDTGPRHANACTTNDDCAGQTPPGPCLDPACNAATGACIFVSSMTGTPCDDGDGCSKNTICSNGNCVGGQPIDCSDDDPCTIDSCTGDGHCQHVVDEFCCTPSCDGKVCGPNGCGGTCGDCPEGTACGATGLCEVSCTPSCGGKVCGDDGCGGSCGACPGGTTCNAAGLCTNDGCVPSCGGKSCGDDGCGGSCGVCPAGQSCQGGQCVPGGCVPDCTFSECGDDGCGGSCGVCPPATACSAGVCSPTNPGQPGSCVDACGGSSPDLSCYCDVFCFSNNDCCDDVCDHCDGQYPQQCDACATACDGKACGDDGCGGSCGACGGGDVCVAGQCQSASQGSTCAEPMTLLIDEPVEHDTSAASDDFFFGNGVCPDLTSEPQMGAPDHVYTFTPSSTGNYTFELDVLSSFYANLFVLGSCQDPEATTLSCLPDSTTFTKELTVWLEGGEAVTVVVDGDPWLNAGGAYNLRVFDYEPCAWADCGGKACGDDGCGYGGQCGQCGEGQVCSLAQQCVAAGMGDTCDMPYVLEGPLPIEAIGSTEAPGTTNAFSYGEGVCPGNLDDSDGNEGLDHVWAFSPPQSGNYTFELDAWESFSGVITYLMGACDSQADGCLGGLPYYDNAPVNSYLQAGKTYHFVVDSYDGSFSPMGEYAFTVDTYSPCFSADCEGKECGDNGCGDGGLCGVCSGDEVCGAGACVDPDAGDTCTNAFDVWVDEVDGFEGAFDSSYASNDYQKDFGVCEDWSNATGSAGEDQAFHLTFAGAGTYRITVTPLDSWYAAVYVVDGSCAQLESDCIAQEDGSSWLGAAIDVEVTAFQSLYVIVDGDTASEWTQENGPYTFTVELLSDL